MTQSVGSCVPRGAWERADWRVTPVSTPSIATPLNPSTVHDDGDFDVIDGFVHPSSQKGQRDWFMANVDGDGDRKKKYKVGGVKPPEVVSDINLM